MHGAHQQPASSKKRDRGEMAAPPVRPSAVARKQAWLAVALVIATCIAYAPAITAPFQFDDIESIATNPTIRRLWPPTVPLHPPKGIAVSGRPIVNYSLALNYALNDVLGVDQRPDPDGRFKTLGLHLGNLAVHLASGLLLFAVLRRTLRSPRLAEEWSASAQSVAWLVTSVWLLHPIQAEAVNYLIQRTELLVSFFYLLTLYCAMRAWDDGAPAMRIRWYAGSVVACLLGMGSKEVMVTAPLLVYVYDGLFRVPSSSPSGRATAEFERKVYYGLLSGTVIVAVVSILTGARADTVGFRLGIPWQTYLYSQAWAIAQYMRLTIVPNRLVADYGSAPISGLGGIPGMLLLVSLGAGTVVALIRRLPVAFLGAWFFLILAPSSSVVPISTEIAAERRFYLPLASVVTLLVLAVAELHRRFARVPDRSGQPRPNILRDTRARVAFIAICATLAVVTFHRSRLYANPELLWRDVIARRPENPRAYNSLSAVLLQGEAPRVQEAEAVLRQAIRADSTYLPAWPNLALVLMEQGKVNEAKGLLERALRINPNDARSVQVLGHLLVRSGDPAAAVPHLERVAASDSTDESLVDLGTAYLALGRTADAALTFRRAVDVNPARADALTFLGLLLTASGNAAEAVPILEHAVSLGAASALSFAALGEAYAAVGLNTKAEGAARIAGDRAGDDPGVLKMAGRALLSAGNAAEAARLLTQAVRLNPEDPEALTNLALAKLGLGDRGEAAGLLRQALEVRQDYMPARRALGAVATAPPPRSKR